MSNKTKNEVEKKGKALRIPDLDLETHDKIEKHLTWLRYKRGDNTLTKAAAASDMLSKSKVKVAHS